MIKKYSFHCISCLVLGSILVMSSAQGQTQNTTQPLGYITINIVAGTGTSYTLSTISLPMHRPFLGQGQLTGTITGVTSTTITNNNAGWSVGSFSAAAAPFAIRITSGNAEGRILLISSAIANTSTTVTIDNQSTDLTELGIIPGRDSYEIFPVDTLLSFFGMAATNGVRGGSSEANADHIQVFSATSGWLSYYFNTTSNKWLRIGPPIDSNNVILRPDQGIMYSRIANTDFRITLIGRVPNAKAKVVINSGGVSFIGSTWPANQSLAKSGIQNLPGWKKSTVYTSADQVQIYTPTNGWRGYYHNGANWMQIGPPINRDNEPISAGSAVMIVKLGNTAGVQIYEQTAPYSVN